MPAIVALFNVRLDHIELFFESNHLIKSEILNLLVEYLSLVSPESNVLSSLELKDTSILFRIGTSSTSVQSSPALSSRPRLRGLSLCLGAATGTFGAGGLVAPKATPQDGQKRPPAGSLFPQLIQYFGVIHIYYTV